MKTVLPEQGDILAELLETSLRELLEAYGVPSRQAPQGEPSSDGPLALAGVIGFTAAQLRGSLVVSASTEDLASMGPSVEDDLALRDWAGELANQLLGRLKNKLLAFGVVLSITPPVVVRGFRLDVSAAKGTKCIRAAARTARGWLRVSLDALADPQALVDVPGDARAGASEGELILF